MPSLFAKPKYVQVKNCRVFHGDCARVLTHPDLSDYKLVFADPPFNIGQEYQGYNDVAPDYEQKLFRWLRAIHDCTSPRGIFCLHGNDELCDLYLHFARQLGFPKRIAWINWHYRFGQCGRSNWIDARCHCLIYARGPNYVWNPDLVLVESDRASLYDDKRIHDTENGGLRLPGTVWGVPSDGEYWGRVQGNNKERRHGHPNQLPEVYLARLIRAYTNPGDRIFDPFGGSGTTAAVAQALGRSCDTIEISDASCQSIVARLKRGAVRV